MAGGIKFVQDLLAVVGPGSFLVLGCEDAAMPGELLARGCRIFVVPGPQARFDHDFGGCVGPLLPDGSGPFDCVIVCGSMMMAVDDPIGMFAALRGYSLRYIALAPGELVAQVHALGPRGQQGSWAQSALAAGYRRAPAQFAVGLYTELNHPALREMSVFELIPDAALETGPSQGLQGNLDPQMDMSREWSPRADASMARYALAAEWARPGDAVLDFACGAGYGSAILAARSAGNRFIGADFDEASVAYARAQFGERYCVEYVVANGVDLSSIADASIDLIVSLETLRRVRDRAALIAEFRRILKPDGRIVASVPDLAADEIGGDPHALRAHHFGWQGLGEVLGEGFIVEARYRQEAPDGAKLRNAQRALERVPLGGAQPDTEWWIVVASADPLMSASANYRHPQFARSQCEGSQVADFGSHYTNPWLYRAMAQMGERIAEESALSDLALRTLGTLPLDSADAGAAITVLGYRVLELARHDHVADICNMVDAYAAQVADNPHMIRWQISGCFLAALLVQRAGDRARAAGYFEQVVEFDALKFSPLLSTKTIAARFWLGIARLVDGDAAVARQHFLAGVEAGRRALHAPDENSIGNPEAPLSFGFQELAEVADMASQCALALAHLDQFARSPGKFWRKVDVRRFGLASWARHLERENESLRQQLAARAASEEPAWA